MGIRRSSGNTLTMCAYAGFRDHLNPKYVYPYKQLDQLDLSFLHFLSNSEYLSLLKT